MKQIAQPRPLARFYRDGFFGDFETQMKSFVFQKPLRPTRVGSFRLARRRQESKSFVTVSITPFTNCRMPRCLQVFQRFRISIKQIHSFYTLDRVIVEKTAMAYFGSLPTQRISGM